MMGNLPPAEARSPLKRVFYADLKGWENDDLTQAFLTFKRSCQQILKSNQTVQRPIEFSGKQQDWLPICKAAEQIGQIDQPTARQFFETNFIPFHVADPHHPQGLFTGYFEPEAEGSLEETADYPVPLYARPDDLVELPETAQQQLKVRNGRWLNGKPQIYFTRKEIEQGALAGKKLEIIWLKNWVDAFFIHIQGSARIRLENRKIIRLSFAAKSGLPYRSIGAYLIDQGELEKATLSMQKLRQWLFDNPQKAREVMWHNPSFVFFRTLPAESGTNLGALGAQKVPLTPRRSLAVDHTKWFYGTPVWLETKVLTGVSKTEDFQHLLIAQDTGSAIRGLARGDVYWGWGEAAAFAAGHMKQEGQMTVLLPWPVAKRMNLLKTP